jgi:hypothetical protein
MSSQAKRLPADQRLTLEAFQSAIASYAQRGLELPAPIAQIVNCLESRIRDLDWISECDSEFESLYQAARVSIHDNWASGKLLSFD